MLCELTQHQARRKTHVRLRCRLQASECASSFIFDDACCKRAAGAHEATEGACGGVELLVMDASESLAQHRRDLRDERARLVRVGGVHQLLQRSKRIETIREHVAGEQRAVTVEHGGREGARPPRSRSRATLNAPQPPQSPRMICSQQQHAQDGRPLNCICGILTFFAQKNS